MTNTITTTSRDDNTFSYFTSYAEEITTARSGGPTCRSDYELEFFNNLLRLQENMITKPKDKDRLTLIAGDILVNLFYMASKTNFQPCSEKVTLALDEFLKRKAQGEKLITFLRYFLHHYRIYNSRKFKRMQTKKDLATWSNRICHLLVKITETDDIHALLLSKIQKPTIEGILEERDIFLSEHPYMEDTILSIRLHPPTYNLANTNWTQMVKFLKNCEIDTTQNKVYLEYIVEKILKYANANLGSTKKRLREELAKRLFCSPECLDLSDSRTLWYPVSRWLSLDSFEVICSQRYPGRLPWIQNQDKHIMVENKADTDNEELVMNLEVTAERS